MAYFRGGGFPPFPPVIKNLLIINGLVFLAQMTFQYNGTFDIDNFFALHDVRSVYFKPHQLVTHLFMHGGFEHILFNMLALWMFGSKLELYWGAKRFLIFYVICGLGAAILHLSVLYIENTPFIADLQRYSPVDQEIIRHAAGWPVNQATVGASGAIFGCLAAFGYLFPNDIIYVQLLIPVKAKWLVLIFAGIELFSAVQNSAGDNVAHWAHLGGAIVGVALVYIWNKTDRRNFY
jgi:membrane associated rhomboid family serine protease